MDINTPSVNKFGQAFDVATQVVTVHNGARGAIGPEGPEGPKGAMGEGINILGAWNTGTTYCPNDAVSWRSSLVSGINSLYVQKAAYACAASTIPPNEDPSRWDEIGAVDWDNSFGGIWNVYQINHGFTMVGQPVGYSFQSDSYVLADARNLDELGICLVREVVDADHVILQSSGEVPNIDEDVIYPSGSVWAPGRVYYVSTASGRLERTPPTAVNYYSNPVLVVTDETPSGRNGVALPWTPSGGPGTQPYITVGWRKFYYVTTAGQTDFTGPDAYGNTLVYQTGENTDVFYMGLNLIRDIQFLDPDGLTITLTAPAVAGEMVEIWTPDRPLDILVPSTAVKMDSISGLFDGVTTDFPLTVNALAVAITNSMNTLLWLDSTAQEPEVDYEVVPDVGVPANGMLRFAFAPEEGTRFWGTVYVPIP